MEIGVNVDNDSIDFQVDQEKLTYYIKNHKSLCKFCLKSFCEKSMKKICEKSSKAPLNDIMIEKIAYTLNNDSLIDDTEYNYINLICTDCEIKILDFYEFKKDCERNSIILLQIIEALEKPKDEATENVCNEIISTIEKPSKIKETSTLYGTVCQICGKLVKGIQTHMLIHQGIKKFKCQYCQKSFTQSGQLKRHINSHLNIRNYVCPHENCDKTFVDSSSVTKHLVVHNKEDRKFVCSLCGSRFSRLGTLKFHEKTHRQEKNHKCTICEKSFMTNNDLTKHVRGVHMREKPYSCPICDKKFSLSKNAKVHLKVHSKEKPYFCQICQLSFGYASSLKQHILKMHQNQESRSTAVEALVYKYDNK